MGGFGQKILLGLEFALQQDKLEAPNNDPSGLVIILGGVGHVYRMSLISRHPDSGISNYFGQRSDSAVAS